jgi:hypothetical protein
MLLMRLCSFENLVDLAHKEQGLCESIRVF